MKFGIVGTGMIAQVHAAAIAAIHGCVLFLQHQRNFEEVLRAIRDGREPSTSAREARKAVALIEAIYRSARNGGARFEPVPNTAAN